MLCTCGDGVAGAKGTGRVWAGNPVPRAGHCAPPAHTPPPGRSHQATACVAGARLVWAGPPRQRWGTGTGAGGGIERFTWEFVTRNCIKVTKKMASLVSL